MKLLKFLDLFKNLFTKMGIDYPAMRKILEVKLVLDSRRTATVLNNPNNKEPKKDKNNFLGSLLIYLVFGVFMVPFIFMGDSILFSMSIVFSMFMFLMMTSLISDFSSVLLDLRDKQIILTKPVNNKTLSMAKFIHIFYYIFMTTLALAGPSLIASIFRHGFIFFIIFLFELILIDLFIIVITGLFYLLILRFFSGEKLKDIINYVQIFLTIFISIGYQLMGRVFNITDLVKIDFNPKLWHYFMPPIWFTGPFELIINGNREVFIIIFSVLAITIPIISIILYIYLMPAFERNLQKLNSAEGQTKNRDKLINLIGRIVCKDKEERTYYRFSSQMIRNERTFKLRVYPSLGFSIIFPFIMLFTTGRVNFSELSQSSRYFNVYFVSFMIPSIIGFISYSGNYKGAWVYNTIPANNKDSIYKGAVKAVFINLLTPVFIFTGIIFLIIFKFRILPDLIIVYLNLMLLTSIVFRIQEKDLPFSLAFGTATRKSGFGELIQTFFALGLLYAFHYFVSKIPYGKIICIIILIISNMIGWKYAYKTKEDFYGNIR